MDLDLAGGEVRVHRVGGAGDDLALDGDHRFGAHPLERRERRVGDVGDDLGEPEMVAQIDEQQIAVVALAVDPARQLDPLADLGGASAPRNYGCDRRACGRFPAFPQFVRMGALRDAALLCQAARPSL